MNIFSDSENDMTEEEKRRILESMRTPITVDNLRMDGVTYVSIESLKEALGRSFASGRAQDIDGLELSHYILINIKNLIQTIEEDAKKACLTCDKREQCDQKDCSTLN